MSSSLRSLLPYANLMDPDHGNPLMAKVQALVSADDKRTVLASLGGDDGVLTFLIQHAFQRTAHHIRAHGLNTYDPTNYARVLAFICDGTVTCASGSPTLGTLAGGLEAHKPTSPSPESLPSTSHKDRARRIRERAEVLKNTKRTEG